VESILEASVEKVQNHIGEGIVEPLEEAVV
jgi:hypothetical protein